MLCNISQNAMRQWGGVRVPPRGGTQSGPGPGTPPGGGPGTPPGGGTRSGPGPGTPPQGGYPVRWGGGVPGQDNRRSTHYTAGGMPLAFTQEDFLVLPI